MPEPEDPANCGDQPTTGHRSSSDDLERRLADLQKEAETRIARAELKVEALRAGMIDLDGLKLLDLTSLKLAENGEVEGATQLMTQLKQSKPWLFGNHSTSSATRAPLVQPPQQKRATEMTDAEYREARAAVLRRRP